MKINPVGPGWVLVCAGGERGEAVAHHVLGWTEDGVPVIPYRGKAEAFTTSHGLDPYAIYPWPEYEIRKAQGKL